MSTGFAEHVRELPSYRRLVRRLRDSLEEGRSLVVVLPDPHDEDDLWPLLMDELRRRERVPERLHLEEVGEGGEPLKVLAGFVGADGVKDLQDLLRRAALPDVLALHGFDSLGEADQRRWLGFVTSWSQASQVLAGDAARCALLLTPRSSRLCVPLPPSDVHLRLEYWVGAPTVEELQHLARHGGGDPAPDRLWRETMVLAYAGEDAGLAERLLATPLVEPSWPSPILERYARERGWAGAFAPQELLRTLTALRRKPVVGPILQDVPAAAFKPWSHGLLNWNPWSGWELHSAWLALHGPEHLLRHRLWRAQVALLLPLVDRLRLAVCAWIGQRHDDDWPLRLASPKDPLERDAVADDPFACQWGHLVEVLRAQELRELQPLQPTARMARDIRNLLAHQKCVGLADFRAFWKGYHDVLARLAERGEALAG